MFPESPSAKSARSFIFFKLLFSISPPALTKLEERKNWLELLLQKYVETLQNPHHPLAKDDFCSKIQKHLMQSCKEATRKNPQLSLSRSLITSLQDLAPPLYNQLKATLSSMSSKSKSQG